MTTPPNDPRFDTMIDRRGTHSSKWDYMERLFGVSAEDGLAMWTADSDWATAPCVVDAVRRAADHGVFGYVPPYDDYHAAIQWWMRTRHNWEIEKNWILTAQGLGNAIAMTLDVFSAPGDHVAIFTPVYHEFAIKINKAGRHVTECPLKREGNRYVLDIDDAQSRLTGKETVLLWCSPQNPSGRVWTTEELRDVAEFARRNDLILVSDEIHQDLVYPGQLFVPMHVAAPGITDRLIVAAAASKTFNIAGQRTGNMIIPDETLRRRMAKRLAELDYKPSSLALTMIEAAYSEAGAEWADAQVAYLAENVALFNAAMDAIPGVHSFPLEATYLAWVDFSGTGMSHQEILDRVRKTAKIAPTDGPGFGTGGELFLRFNLATPRARVQEACDRLTAAFSDLQ